MSEPISYRSQPIHKKATVLPRRQPSTSRRFYDMPSIQRSSGSTSTPTWQANVVAPARRAAAPLSAIPRSCEDRYAARTPDTAPPDPPGRAGYIHMLYMAGRLPVANVFHSRFRDPRWVLYAKIVFVSRHNAQAANNTKPSQKLSSLPPLSTAAILHP